MNSVAIIDYGMGNLHSIAKAVEHVASDARVHVTHDVGVIKRADRVVFPGVGAIRHCMEELERLELAEAIKGVAAERPLLGVCLGMQAFLSLSDENDGTECLDLIPGRVVRFADPLTDPATGERLKVPHMGWNKVQQTPHALWKGIAQDTRFYFVHSYYAVPNNAEHSVGATDYGHRFTSAVARDNLFAVQFHPEKSHTAGLRLLANFMAWNGQV